jgi:putative hydrolase of the HAD superfamily
MVFRAVLFDLGGTLMKTAPIQEIYKSILELYGIEVSAGEILEALDAHQNSFDPVEGQLRMGERFWDEWNRAVLERAGIREDSAFLGEKVTEHWWDHAELEVFPDVLETLDTLRSRGVKTGIVTNGFRYDYERILEALDLAGYFDVVVGVDTCGVAKPDGRIFLHAVDELGVEPGEVVFVGNEHKYDYVGAKGAGLKPLLIDREGDAPEDADVIESLTEVVRLL